jgi:hypothetical protein
MDQLLRPKMDTNEVDKIERELTEAIMHQITVEKELEIILGDGDMFFNRAGGIHSVPIEILVKILYESTSDIWNGHIGRLMRVCRLWQQVILNTPLLWSTIHISVPIQLDKLNICVEYCRNSVKRSASTLLDIDLYFPEIKHNYFSKQNCGLVWNEKSWGPRLLSKVIYGNVAGYLERLQAYHAWRDQLLHTLMGNEGEIMARWESFECYFSQEEGQNSILTFLERGGFDYPTPSLKRLVLNETRGPYTKRPGMELTYAYNLPKDKDPPSNFPYMPNIRVLHLPNIETLIQRHGIDRSSIRELVFFCKNHDSLRFILSLRDLTDLQIGFYNTTWDEPELGQQTMVFPHLRTLCIVRGITRVFWTLLEAPNLETLILEDLLADEGLKLSIHIKNMLPSLREIRIRHRWGYYTREHFDFLHEVIRHAPALTSIHCDREREFIDAVKRFRCETVPMSRPNRPYWQLVHDGEGGLSSAQSRNIYSLLVLKYAKGPTDGYL